MSTDVVCPIDGYRARQGNEPKHPIGTSSYTPILDAEHNAKVIDLTHWAIDEYNKEREKQGAWALKFREVDSASYSACKMMYYIRFKVWVGRAGRAYEAKVWEESWSNSKKLVEFKEI